MYRYQKIPVIIYNFTPERVEASRQNTEALSNKGVKSEDKSHDFKDDGESQVTLDDFTSGHYVIGGIEYIYEEGDISIRQRLTMLRREWPVKSNDL